MKILLVSSKYMPEYSGSGFRAHNLYKRLCAKHPEIKLRILCCSITENSCADYEYESVNVSRIAAKPYPGGASSSLAGRFRNWRNFESEYKKTSAWLAKIDKPDLIHIFGQSYVSAAALDYAVKHKIPVMTELCNELKTPFHYIPFPSRIFVNDKALPEKHMFVCISRMLRDLCLRNGIPENDVWCRPNPVNQEIFKPVDLETKFALRNKLTRFGKDVKLVSYVAKFRESKNHIFMLDVIKHLPENYKLFMTGPLVDEGVSSDKLTAVFKRIQDKIHDEHLEDRVELKSGFVKNINEHYQMSEVFVFPSSSEGLGTPMLESIASAVPVVANRLKDVTDVWIKDNMNGFLSSLDAAEYASKILKASEISRETLLKESAEILAKASTDVIDSEYISLIRKLGSPGN